MTQNFSVDALILDIVSKIEASSFRGNARSDVASGYQSSFGHIVQIPFIEQNGGYIAPLPQARRVYVKQCVGELAAFLSGCTKNSEFEERGCKFWKPWADKGDDLGPIYGAQWKDQMHDALCEMYHNRSRRAVVSAWNPNDIDKMRLPPCHFAFQLHRHDDVVNLTWFQRSVDVPVGLPYNILSYWLLCYIIAKTHNLKPGMVTGLLSDCHVYDNQRASVGEWKEEYNKLCYDQFNRLEVPSTPTITLNDVPHPCADYFWKSINTVEKVDSLYKLENYNPTKTIKFEVTV